MSEFEEFTHCHDIKASKVKEMYTCEILNNNTSYLKLNKVSHNTLKRHMILPQHAVWTMWTFGQCGGMDSQNTERPPRIRWNCLFFCYLFVINNKQCLVVTALLTTPINIHNDRR